MKKILSLLSLLVMTLTAFATDYTGHRTVTYGSNEPTESDNAVVSIVDNGDGTYNVSFVDVINVDGPYRDNYGTYTFSNLACTTENGVTTFTGSGLTAAVTHSNPNSDYSFIKSASEGELTVKFNAEKAYAKFAATISTGWSSATISAEFGTDDFETGGGEPEGPTVEVTVKEMSDGSNNIDFSFGSSVIEANGLTKGTDAKGRTTYTGDVDVQGTVYKVYAVIYTDADGTEKIYMSVESEGVTYIVGTKPVDGPSIPMENYQADGTGFKESTAIDWETQKFQAVIDASNCNASRATEELLGFGPDATVWNDNVHVYCKSDGTYTAFYDPTENRDAENPNNNSSFSVEDKSNITIEISKAEGLVIDGKTIIAAERLNKGLFDLTEVTYGSGEGTDQYSTALYKSIKLINLNKKEEPVFVTYTAPAMYTYASMDEETPGAKRFVEAQEIQLSDNGDGTYTVIIKNLGDCEGDPAGDVQFTATATEAEDGTISLTADTQVELGGYYEGSGEYAVKFNGTLNGEDLTATYDIDIPSGAAHAEFGNGVTNGINTVNNTNNTITSIYTVGGAKVNSLQKGVNIVRLANGKTVKVIK